MKSIQTPPKSIRNINMHFVVLPLRVIAGLSAMVFVLFFCYEIFISYGTQTSQKWVLSGTIFILAVWAIFEMLSIETHVDSLIVKNLRYLLLFQVGVAIVRPVMNLIVEMNTNHTWVMFSSLDMKWRWILLVVYSGLFILIMDSIIGLFTFNEKNKAKAIENQMLDSLNALALARDNETGNHIIRTQNYVKMLALRLRKMGYYKNELNDQEIELLFKAAPLHDIGKVGIPDHILLKNGSLNDEEWQIMKTHASIGETILSSAGQEFQGDENVIRTAFKIAGGHHEKWDGTGYPRNLSGQDIPLSARIMALADVYDALVSKRVYKKRWSHQDAIKEIVSKKGQHFDPLVVDAFILEEDQFLAISRQYEDS